MPITSGWERFIAQQRKAEVEREALAARKKLEIELTRYKNALERIRNDEGKVCSNFMECDHRACNSSYSAWAIADEALGASRCTCGHEDSDGRMDVLRCSIHGQGL